MEDSASITMSSLPPSQYDIDEMSRRVMYTLVHEITLQPQTREFDKDVVWKTASSIPGVFTEYGPGLKDTIFQILAQQEDIMEL
jgi:hypothetical protein